jgi:type IV pilus assembly protein PilA
MDSRGFTLMELLVVVAIIGVLAAIAVPEYQSYRARSFDTRALSDLRNVAIGEEAYFLDTERYLNCQNNTCIELPGVTAISRDTTIQIAAADISFTGSAHNNKGSGRIYQWDSENGGLQR